MACDLDVRVVPRASPAGIAGTRGQAVLVRLAAAPVDGAANAELVETLARALGVPRRDVSIRSGVTSRTKRIHVSSLSRAEALTRLGLPA